MRIDCSTGTLHACCDKLAMTESASSAGGSNMSKLGREQPACTQICTVLQCSIDARACTQSAPRPPCIAPSFNACLPVQLPVVQPRAKLIAARFNVRPRSTFGPTVPIVLQFPLRAASHQQPLLSAANVLHDTKLPLSARKVTAPLFFSTLLSFTW